MASSHHYRLSRSEPRCLISDTGRPERQPPSVAHPIAHSPSRHDRETHSRSAASLSSLRWPETAMSICLLPERNCIGNDHSRTVTGQAQCIYIYNASVAWVKISRVKEEGKGPQYTCDHLLQLVLAIGYIQLMCHSLDYIVYLHNMNGLKPKIDQSAFQFRIGFLIKELVLWYHYM